MDPGAIEKSDPRRISGVGEMTTDVVVDNWQPSGVVMVNVYVVVTIGLATGLDRFGLFSPVDGDQEYCKVPAKGYCERLPKS